MKSNSKLDGKKRRGTSWRKGGLLTLKSVVGGWWIKGGGGGEWRMEDRRSELRRRESAGPAQRNERTAASAQPVSGRTTTNQFGLSTQRTCRTIAYDPMRKRGPDRGLTGA